MNMTVTYTKPAAYIIWACLGLFKKRQYCQACDQKVTPRTVGGFLKIEDGSVGVWHSSVPCLMALMHYSKNSGSSVDGFQNGG